MRLYISGHAVRFGYAIEREWSDAECSAMTHYCDENDKPIRFVSDRKRAFDLVNRWNRRFSVCAKKVKLWDES
jgi:hypothetical protein